MFDAHAVVVEAVDEARAEFSRSSVHESFCTDVVRLSEGAELLEQFVGLYMVGANWRKASEMFLLNTKVG